MQESNKNEMLERLILMGAVEPASMNAETGEMLFSFSPNLDKVSPELYAKVNDMFASIMMTLWSKGFLDLRYENDSLDPLIFLTEKSNNDFEVSLLPEFERVILNNIINFFGQEQV